jgi:ABC-2 type transport system permease protein
MFAILFKTLRDKRFFILGWSLGLVLLGFVMITFYPSFNGGQIDELIKSVPAALQGMVGDLQDWRDLASYIGSQIFDIRMPIFIAIFSILLAVSLTVGEEDKGQLRTLIALPLSRRRIIFGKEFAIILLCLVASLAPVIGVEIGLLAIGEDIDQIVLVRLGLMTWLLVSSLATLIFAVGLATGKRALTTALGIIVTIGGFLLSTFSQAVDWLKDYEWLSLFHYFPAIDIAHGTIAWSNVVFYLMLLALSLVAVVIFFPRRDVRAE